jgi:dihydrofolate reductase
MFSGGFGPGPWENDPNPDGWWGDEPPFKGPVFVLTHHPRETLEMQGGTSFTFVTDGVENAVEQAQAVAGGKDVTVAGGAEAIQHALAADLLDELQIHFATLLLVLEARARPCEVAVQRHRDVRDDLPPRLP